MPATAIALSEPERQNIYALRIEGRSLREIGAATGRHWTTVRHAIAADGQQAKLATVRTMRSAIAHFRFAPQAKRLRLLRVCDDVLLEARNWCRGQQIINAGMLSHATRLSYDDAMTFLRVFWWVSRPVSLRHRA